MRPTDPRPAEHADVAYEKRDTRVSAVLGFGFGLLVLGGVVQLGMWGLFRLFASAAHKEQTVLQPNVAASLKRTPSQPRLEPLPLAPRQALRASEDARLSTYGWVDRSGGIARIPIDRAMQLILERGVPGGKPFPPAQAGAPLAASPGAPAR